MKQMESIRKNNHITKLQSGCRGQATPPFKQLLGGRATGVPERKNFRAWTKKRYKGIFFQQVKLAEKM